MTNMQTSPVVDADGHVLEPADTYTKYIDPKYRDRALRIACDEKGHENLIIDNKPYQSTTMRGNLGAIGGIGMDPKLLYTRGAVTYAEGSPPGGYDPQARLKVMDEEGIDIALLYPTLGIFWEGAVQDPQLATAYTRAYNRWIVDFCQENPTRLYPIAHVSLLDPDGAVEEVRRAAKAGCIGVYLSPDLPARRDKRFDDPAFTRFWETVQDLEMPIAFHVVVREHPTFHEWTRYRQCLVSADPDESMTAQIVAHMGADYFVWASDYPHVDASFGVVAEMKERLAPLPPADQQKVLGENAVRFYQLTV